MSRTDPHRPSAINPSEYEYVAIGSMKINDLGDCYEITHNRAMLERHMNRTGGRWSTHEHGGNCGVCGAHCIWTVIFWHAPTNTYIRTGNDCADKLGMAFDQGELDRFKRSAATAEKNRAGKAKAKLMLEESGLGRAWEINIETENMLGARRDFAQKHVIEDNAADAKFWWQMPDCPQDLSKDRTTLNDMISKMVAWGDDWSERQKDFARILVERIDNQARIAAEREAEHAAAAPVPITDKRILIEGEVLSTKVVETYFGYVTKVLVRTDAGWKVYGSNPCKDVEARRGDRMSFMARVTASDGDPKFGFFSRPTGGKVVGTCRA